MRNILLKIEYDGTNFHGWQRQRNLRTVQGLLEEKLTSLCGEAIELCGTSRTDAGVHAFSQMATFESNCRIPIERLPFVVNNILGKCDVRVVSAEEKDLDFRLRSATKGKTYVYRILNAEGFDIFARNHFWQIEEFLDINSMNEAAAHLIGTHDFAAFQAAGGIPRESTVRTISGIDVSRKPSADGRRTVEIRVTGNGFLYNMMRIISGTLAETGLGSRKPEDMAAVLESKDRRNAGRTAPPQGLYLMDVYY